MADEMCDVTAMMAMELYYVLLSLQNGKNQKRKKREKSEKHDYHGTLLLPWFQIVDFL
jgi:hypothetical protein